MKKVLLHGGRAAAGIGAGIGMVAVLVRLTLRDRLPAFSTLFYSTPPAVIGILFALSSGAALLLRKRKAAAGLFVAALVAVGWQALAYRYSPPETVEKPETIRLMLWNVARGVHGWTRIAEEIRRENPDLACFVEAGADSPEQQKAWRTALPDHDRRRLDGGIILGIRGTLREAVRYDLDRGGRAVQARVTVRGRDLTVVVVDFWADPLQSRRDAFKALDRILEPLSREPLVVLGDFNTPDDSVHFDPLRARFSHAFEEAGAGYGATWPMPLPILTIDHVWLGPPLKAASCRLMGSGASDHRAVIAELY